MTWFPDPFCEQPVVADGSFLTITLLIASGFLFQICITVFAFYPALTHRAGGVTPVGGDGTCKEEEFH
ncbi:hypothetical protein HWE06_22250 [Pantoea dispersa]|nr:hypothetical protein [Pantoea dispersa]